MAACRAVGADGAGGGDFGAAEIAEKAADDLLLALRDHRPDVAIGDGRANGERGIAGGHAGKDLVMDAALDEDARGGRAGLAGILDAGIDEEGQRPIEIGIGEDELGRLATELERHWNDVLGSGLLDEAADGDRAGERDVIDAGVGGERSTGLFAEAGNDVERAGGQAGLLGDAGEGNRGETGLLGGLQHDGIAHGQGAADRAAEHLHGIVPRDDVAGDAVRLAQGVDGIAIEIGDGLAMHLIGGAAIELHVAGEGDCIGAGLFERLADIEGFEPGEVVDALEHHAADAGENAAALGSGRAAPGAGEGGAGGGHGGIVIGGAAAGNAGDDGAVGGVLDRQGFAGDGIDPAATDEALGRIEEQGGIGLNGHGVRGLRRLGGRGQAGSGRCVRLGRASGGAPRPAPWGGLSAAGRAPAGRRTLRERRIL